MKTPREWPSGPHVPPRVPPWPAPPLRGGTYGLWQLGMDTSTHLLPHHRKTAQGGTQPPRGLGACHPHHRQEGLTGAAVHQLQQRLHSGDPTTGEDRHFHVEALAGNLTRDPLHLGRPGANSLWFPPEVCQGGSRVAAPPPQRGPAPSTRKAWLCTGLGSASTRTKHLPYILVGRPTDMKRSVHNGCQGEPSTKKENQSGQCQQWRRGEDSRREEEVRGTSPRRCPRRLQGEGCSEKGTAQRLCINLHSLIFCLKHQLHPRLN